MNTLDINEAAKVVGIQPDALRRMMKDRTAPGAKIGRGWIVPEDLLRKWMANPRSVMKLKPKPPHVSEASLRAAAEKIAEGMLEPEISMQLGLNLTLSSAAHTRKRKAAIRRATPPWADRAKILRLYVTAKERTLETGILHSVDHVIPLHHRKVCGLHVHRNMRVITQVENSTKHNFWREQ